MAKYIDFAAIEELATIEQLADMLGLKTKRSGRQLRSSCPTCGGDERTLAITPDVRSKRGSVGVFFCQSAKTGGDRIGLVAHCMDLGQQDAAYFIAEQFGTGNSTVEGTVNSTVSNSQATVPQKTEGEIPSTSAAALARPKSASASFDPEKFGASLNYDAHVEALGISKENAALYRIGTKREKLFVPICPADVVPACWAEIEGGKVKLPDKWLPTNVVKFKRPA